MTNTAQKIDTSAFIDPAVYTAISEAIRTEAKKVLENGAVAAVVGYRAGRRAGTAMPVIVSDPSGVESLIFSPACVNNLALYLTKAKKEVRNRGKIAIVAKGCDLKALVGLMGENQLKRDDVFIIGVQCAGVFRGNVDQSLPLSAATIANKCKECTAHVPEGTDVTVGRLPELPTFTPEEAEQLAKLEAMTPDERWAFWKEQFSRCVRCMACRQVCPFCYCELCMCDRNRPQAVETTPRPAGNMAWHITRAMHLAGRCAGCAECERACPMDIPLNLLNRKMANELKELYGHEAGFAVKEKGPLNEYKETDDQSFIK